LLLDTCTKKLIAQNLLMEQGMGIEETIEFKIKSSICI